MTGGGTIIGRQGTPVVAVLLTVVGLELETHALGVAAGHGTSALALRVAVMLLVLVVGGGPLLHVASAPLALLLTRPPLGTDPAVIRPSAPGGPGPTDPGLVRCLPRRGPPGDAARA